MIMRMKKLFFFFSLYLFVSCGNGELTSVKLIIEFEDRFLPLISNIKLSIFQNGKVVWWRNYRPPFNSPIELSVVKGRDPFFEFQIDIYKGDINSEPIVTKRETINFRQNQIIEYEIYIECPLNLCQDRKDGGMDTIDIVPDDISDVDAEEGYDIRDITEEEEVSPVPERVYLNPGCDPDVAINGFDAIWSIEIDGETKFIRFVKGDKFWTLDLIEGRFLEDRCGKFLEFLERTTFYPQAPQYPSPWSDPNVIQNGISAGWSMNDDTSTRYIQISSPISLDYVSYIWGYDFYLNQWIFTNNMTGELIESFKEDTSDILAGQDCPQPETYPGYNSVFQQNGISAMTGVIDSGTNLYVMFSSTLVWLFYTSPIGNFHPVFMCEYSIVDYFNRFPPIVDCSQQDSYMSNPACDPEVANSGIDAAFRIKGRDGELSLHFVKGKRHWSLVLQQEDNWVWDTEQFLEDFPRWLVDTYSEGVCPEINSDYGWCMEDNE